MRRALLFAALLLGCNPAVAAAFDAPQLFYRAYEPGVEHPWLPLQGAVVDIWQPEIGVLVPADPSGRDPGVYLDVTSVPDSAPPSGALGQRVWCTALPGYAGQVDPLDQLEFRGFGAYTIHAESLTNQQATTQPCTGGQGVPANVSFTVAASPTLETDFAKPNRTVVDDENIVDPTLSTWNDTPSDYVCARGSATAADGTPSGPSRFTRERAGALELWNSRLFPASGTWSCVARFEATSQGDGRVFTGPWGPLFTFGLFGKFSATVHFTATGGQRISIRGTVNDTAADGTRIALRIAPGGECPRAPTVTRSLRVASNGTFGLNLSLPQRGDHGYAGYYGYGWRVRLHFPGIRYLPASTQLTGLAILLAPDSASPRFKTPQVQAFDGSVSYQAIHCLKPI